MEKVKNTVGAQDSISYEELKNLADQLQQQNKFLTDRLLEKESAVMFKRLDYLFLILKNSRLFDDSIVRMTVSEVSSAIYPEYNTGSETDNGKCGCECECGSESK